LQVRQEETEIKKASERGAIMMYLKGIGLGLLLFALEFVFFTVAWIRAVMPDAPQSVSGAVGWDLVTLWRNLSGFWFYIMLVATLMLGIAFVAMWPRVVRVS
jgi:hypothetical protein